MKTIEVITCHVVVTKMASLRVVLGCGEIGRRRLSEDKPVRVIFIIESAYPLSFLRYSARNYLVLVSPWAAMKLILLSCKQE